MLQNSLREEVGRLAGGSARRQDCRLLPWPQREGESADLIWQITQDGQHDAQVV